MIHESHYWKIELIKLSKKLTKRLNSGCFWLDSQYGAFEKDVMIGFYIIRKLIESHKLSNKLVSTSISLTRYPNNGKIVHIMNTHKYENCFDFDSPAKSKLNLLAISNRIIHSYIFSPLFELNEMENGLELTGLHFCSDDDRNKYLYEISLPIIIDIFQKVGTNYPAGGSMSYNEAKKDYTVLSKDEPDYRPTPNELNEIIKQVQKGRKKK